MTQVQLCASLFKPAVVGDEDGGSSVEGVGAKRCHTVARATH